MNGRAGTMAWQRAVVAGGLYFLAVFALGFGLGAARELWLAPRTGAMAATAIELPVMLAASFVAARRLARRHDVAGAGPLAGMGATGLVLLIAAEVTLGVAGFGRNLGEVIAGMTSPPGLLGLAGQIVFALMPLAAGRRPG